MLTCELPLPIRFSPVTSAPVPPAGHVPPSQPPGPQHTPTQPSAHGSVPGSQVPVRPMALPESLKAISAAVAQARSAQGAKV